LIYRKETFLVNGGTFIDITGAFIPRGCKIIQIFKNLPTSNINSTSSRFIMKWVWMYGDVATFQYR